MSKIRKSLSFKKTHALLATLMTFFAASQAGAVSGITYTGRIMDSNNEPVVATQVIFTSSIYDETGKCLLYEEQRQLDLSLTSGSFAYDIGSNDSGIVLSAGFNGGPTGPQNLTDVFNNSKTFTGLGTANGCPNTLTPPSDSTAGRLLAVTFRIGAAGPIQALPWLKITPVPSSLQAYAVDGYGTGDLLKVNPSVDKTANANSALSQAQYNEFWRLVKNPVAAYLPLTGDVSVVSGNNKLTTLLGQALPVGPATNGQVLVSNGTAWTLQTVGGGSVTSVGGTLPISSSGGATPTISISKADSLTDGYLDKTDFAAFSAKQSNALADGSVWIGNSSGGAQARVMSGDATISNTGAVALTAIVTAGTTGSSGYVPVITYDAKGRITSVTSAAVNDSSKLPLNGGTMSGALNMGGQDITNAGHIAMAGNKYFTLSTNAVNGTAAGQMWFDGANIKYFDGTSAQTLGVAGAGITNFNGSTQASQSLMTPGTSGNAPNWSTNTGAGQHTLNIPMASSAGTVTAGLISNAEYAALTAKQSSSLASAQVWIGNASGVAEARALSGDVTIDNVGSMSLAAIKGKTVDATAASTMGQVLFFDSVADKWKVSAATAPTDGQVLKWNNTTKTWEPGTDTGGWTAVDATYAQKGIVQFQTDAATSAINVASGVANVVRTTTGTASTILALDGSSVGNMSGLGLLGSGGTVTLQTATPATGTYSLKLPAAQGGANQVLSNDGSGNLSWSSVLTGISNSANLADSKIWVGNASGKAAEVSMSGDATMDNAGVLTLASTITAGGPVGTSGYVPVITYDAKGRLTAVTSAAVNDTTKLPLAGGTMSGAINMGGQDITNTGNITMAGSKYFTLSNNSTNGSSAGQMWFDGGMIKYYDGSGVKTLGVQGAGITSINGSTQNTQSFLVPGTSGNAPNWSINAAAGEHTLNIPMASSAGTVTAGLISNAEYTALNGKQSNALADTNVWIGNSSGGAQARQLSGDATVSNTGVVTVDKTQTGAASKILQLDASSVANMSGAGIKGATSGVATIKAPMSFTNYTLTLPADDGTANQVLQTDGAGVLSWGNPAGDPTKLPLAGGTMSGNIDMGGQDITNADVVSASNYYSGWGNVSSLAYSLGSGGGLYMPVADTLGIVTGGAERMRIDSTGNVAIGVTTPNAKLGVSGVTRTTGLDINSTYAGSQASIRAPGAFTSYTLTLPTTVGSANQFLQTDGSGVLTWAAPSPALPGLAAGQVWVGNASGAAEARALSGDIFSTTDTGLVTVVKTTTGEASKILALDGTGVANVKGLDVQTGAGKVTLQTAGAFTNYVLTMPTAQGGANQVMSNDGNGVLSWVTALTTANGIVKDGNSFGSTLTIGTNDNFDFALEANNNTALTVKPSGNIGIGTNAPDTTLHIYSTQPSTSAQPNRAGLIIEGEGATHGGRIATRVYSATEAPYFIGYRALGTKAAPTALTSGKAIVNLIGYGYDGSAWSTNTSSPGVTLETSENWSGTNKGSRIVFGTVANGTTTADERLRIDHDGEVGIGTTAPASKLDVSGVTRSTGLDVNATYGGSQASIRAPGSFTSYTLTLPTTVGTANQFLQTDGTGALTWAAPSATLPGLADTNMWVGNSSGGPQARAMSGDATMSNTGAVTLASTITAGSVGSASYVPVITYDAKGRLTAVTSSFVNDASKLPLVGGTLSGPLTMGSRNEVRFAEVDGDYIGFRAPANVPANFVWNLPAGDGTVGQLLKTDGSGNLGWVSDASVNKVSKSGDSMTGPLQLDSRNEIRFADLDSSNYIGFKAPATVGSNVMWVLPATDGSANQVLKTDGSGTLSWATALTGVSNLADLASNKIWIGNASGKAAEYALSGDATMSNTGVVTVDKTQTGAASKILQLDSSGVANMYGAGIIGNTSGVATLKAPISFSNYTLTLPADAGTASQVLQTDGTGVLSWITPGLPANGLVTFKVQYATYENITLSGLQSIDYQSVVAGDRILVKNQTNKSENGVYVASAGAWTRAADLDSWSEAVGYNVYVESGDYAGGFVFQTDSEPGGTLGSTAIVWSPKGSSLNWTRNTAMGHGAFQAPSDAENNTAFGAYALSKNSTGWNNVAIGQASLRDGIAPQRNVAVGGGSLYSAGGQENVAIGDTALGQLATGNGNIAIGTFAGISMTSGNYNVLIGKVPAANLSGLSNNILVADGQGNERFLINSSGNMGLGVTDPALIAARLHINGGAFLAGPKGTAAGDGGEVRMGELATNGTNYVGFKAPDTLAGNVIWRLPAADGSANQVLTTDGSGVLSWTTPAGGSLPALAATKIWVGNASGGPEARTLGGDVSAVSNAGAVTVVKTTTGTASTILSLDGSSVGNMSGLGLLGSGGTVTLQTATPATGTYSLKLPAAQGAANQTLSNDGSGNLSWASFLSGVTNTASLTNNKLWVGNASGKAVEVSMSGDATMSNTGVVTVDKTQSGAASKILQLDASSIANTGGFSATANQNTAYASSSGTLKTPAGGVNLSLNNWQATSATASYMKFNVYNTSSNDQYAYMGAVSTSGATAWSPAIVFGQSTSSGSYTEVMRVHSNNNVGIGTTAPVSKLEVAGGSLTTAYSAVTTLAIDFSTANVISTTAAAGTLVMSNIRDGTSYSLIVQNTGSYTMTASGISTWRCSPSCPSGVVNNPTGHVVITILKAGTIGYVSYITDMN